MKLRATFSLLAIAAAVSACSSSSSGGGTPAGGASTGGGGTVTSAAASGGGGSSGDFCANLQNAVTKLSNIGNVAGGGDYNAAKTVVEQELTAFQDLANGAPAEVKPTIDDIVTGLQTAAGALADPTHPDLTKLTALGTKLPADLSKLGTYTRSNCS